MSAYLPIRELATAILPTGHREGFLMLIRAYFDDSGTHANSDVVVLGGLLGSVDQWTQFETAWAAKFSRSASRIRQAASADVSLKPLQRSRRRIFGL